MAIRNYVKALGKGVLKIMSKMGISTVSSYCGAQVFEAVGLDNRLLQRYFAGTSGRIGGAGLAEIHAEVKARHEKAYPRNPAERTHRRLEVGGEYQWRREGELHLFNPETVFLLQHATRSKQYDVFKQYTGEGRRPGRRRPVRCAGCSASGPAREPIAARRGRAGHARSSSGSPPAR